MDSELENVDLDQPNKMIPDEQSSFTCDYCNQSFILKCNLVSHIRAHIGDKPHSCDVCNESFSTKSGLALHFRIHKDIGAVYRSSSPENHRFICNYCEKGFSLKSNLILHIRTHTGERPYRCSYCNKTSATKYNLLSHIRTHYSQKTIKCGYCDKYFSSRKNLHSHVQIHISTKRYYCSYCDKSSIHKGTLRVHERIHTGEKPYKCIYCSKSFNHRSNLTHHVRIHTGERPYVCKYCNKAFRQKYALDGHERIHTGAKPYVCVDCNKCFPYSASLRSHMKQHYGEQVFTCYYCMKSFTSKVSLSLHIRIHLWNKNPTKKYVNKNDEILLQQALAAQNTPPVIKNNLKMDPLVVSKVEHEQTTVKIDYDNPQVDSVVNILLTPELESGLVQDLNDNSSSPCDLKNKLREQLCKFMNKYSLKNLPSKRVATFKSNVPIAPSSAPPKPKTSAEYYKMMPTLKSSNTAANPEPISFEDLKNQKSAEYYKMMRSLKSNNAVENQQTSNVTSVFSPQGSNDRDLRANAIAEIEKLGLKERISTQLKTIVNSGMFEKERRLETNRYRAVIVPLPRPREENLKLQMNSRLQKLFQTNLVKRFDTLASNTIENKVKPEIVHMKEEKVEPQITHQDVDEINLNSTSCEAAADSKCIENTVEPTEGENIANEPITEVHIKMEAEEAEEPEEGIVIC
ncbi:zinc finger protein 502-like [Planococcus citri]|uniref:zinc finger protein 502-like n=1 Tax=Planococcus citri TaxID=170843 RepID=UPI0031F86B22